MKKFTPKEQRITARVLRQVIRDLYHLNEEQDYLDFHERCNCLTPEGFNIRGGKECKCGKPEKAVISLLRLVEKNSRTIIKLVQPVRRRK